MGCIFCASGVAGLKRQLGADEIVGQVLVGRTRLDPHERLRNVVYMGMGRAASTTTRRTARSLRLLTHREGIALSARRVTCRRAASFRRSPASASTSGATSAWRSPLHAAGRRDAHAPDADQQEVPAAGAHGRAARLPLPRRRRITIEYTLVAGRNDTPGEAKKVAKLLRGLPVKINLIPMNPIAASPLEPPKMAGVLEFQQVLCDAGYSCFIRRRRGDDVSAACGQLALLGAKPKVRVNRL